MDDDTLHRANEALSGGFVNRDKIGKPVTGFCDCDDCDDCVCEGVALQVCRCGCDDDCPECSGEF